MGTPITTKIAIAGQGIAGLTVASMLARLGFDIHIVGQPVATQGGLQLATNAVAALDKIGLSDAISVAAMRLDRILISAMDSGIELAEIPAGDKDSYIGLARADLIQILKEDIAKHKQVRILQADITAVHEMSGGQGQLVLADGTFVQADEIIGADGGSGLCRAFVAGGGGGMRPSGYRAMRAELSADLLPRHFNRPSVRLMLGEGCHMVAYPIAGGKRVNVVLCVDERLVQGDWTRQFFANNPQFSSLADPSIKWMNIPLPAPQILPVWRRGCVSLIGDAAHIMPPHLAQGASQTFGDIACLHDHLTAGKPLSQALSAMTISRAKSLRKVIQKAALSGEMMRLRGPFARGRNDLVGILGPDFLRSWMADIWHPAHD